MLCWLNRMFNRIRAIVCLINDALDKLFSKQSNADPVVDLRTKVLDHEI